MYSFIFTFLAYFGFFQVTNHQDLLKLFGRKLQPKNRGLGLQREVQCSRKDLQICPQLNNQVQVEEGEIKVVKRRLPLIQAKYKVHRYVLKD